MNLRPRRREDPEINLTPLIDVVFLMLIFFMVSTTFLRESDLQVSLPEASTEVTAEENAPVELTINRQGSFFINGEALVNSRPETLRRALEDAIGAREAASVRVVVRADAESAHRLVVRALDAAGQVGLRRVGIATIPVEE
ncbi:ExbD/TolR family protein [Spiribacter halobius]|uniref:Biopolymer transporter ExbD n=1 Tax=Sediminicurvatus halobius TaxID=2182432 RepID=A0A2U2N2D7_9GAMM|nr:biopolymer transporter ExbD [Spiribacter halobius]PWG63227.1 biopolymer transporter ExbD [Spiribacter halobius]UEX76702.1 biopolymer transporter ExbD [Spiribacter halobius]